MKPFKNKANSFVYAIILVNLALIIALVVYNNTFVIKNSFNFSENNNELTSNLSKKAEININLVKQYNTNWWWFSDNIWCPEVITFFTVNSSWQVVPQWTSNSTFKYEDGVISCEFLYWTNTWKIYTKWINFSFIDYESEIKNLIQTGSNLMTNSQNIDGTYIIFQSSSLDNIDDNLNSDDFRPTSKNWVEYPNWYIDDDIFPRTIVVSDINTGTGFYNVFWNNTDIRDAVNNNSFNNDSPLKLVKIWDVELWNLALDISSSSELKYRVKIIEFDKLLYDSSKELSPIKIYNSNVLNLNFWYIVIDSNWLISLNKNKLWTEYKFDLKNKDYAIFIENNWTWALRTQLSWEEFTSGKKIYLNAINDSYDDKIETLVNHIIISDNSYIKWDYKKIESKDYFNNLYNCKKSWELVEAWSRYPWCDTNDIIMCNWVKSGLVLASCNIWSEYSWLDQKSYWDYFQWWRNIWFSNTKNIIEINWDTNSRSPINFSDRDINTNLIWSPTLNSNRYDWSISQEDDAWWDITNTHISRQWPCMNWYHVPSNTEWSSLLWLWYNNSLWLNWWTNNLNSYSNSWVLPDKLLNLLKIPLAWYRAWNDWLVHDKNLVGKYWSSSRSWTNAYFLDINTWLVSSKDNTYRWNAFNVRCFKNN